MLTDEQVKLEVENRLKAFVESNPKDGILDSDDVSDDVKILYILMMEDAEKKMKGYKPFPLTLGQSPIVGLLEQIIIEEFKK